MLYLFISIILLTNLKHFKFRSDSTTSIIIRQMEGRTQLVRAISRFAKEHQIENEKQYVVLGKFYNANKGDPTFYQQIREVVQSNLEFVGSQQFIEYGLVVAYLTEIEPQFSETILQEQIQYFWKSIVDLNQAKEMKTIECYSELASKLMVGTLFSQIMKQILVQSDKLTPNCYKMYKLLGVLQNRLEWVTFCEKNQLNDRSQQVHNYINIILNGFKNMNELKDSNIMSRKVQLLNSCLLYLVQKRQNQVKKEIQSSNNIVWKKSFAQEITKCLKQIPKFQESERQLFELMKNMIQVYGIFDQNWLIKFIRSNYNSVTKISFLQLLKTLISRYEEAKEQAKLIPKEVYYDILNQIYSSVFTIKKPNAHATYQTIKLMSDIAITINCIYPLDFTKEITKKLHHTNDQYHSQFLISLLYIYNVKISCEVIKHSPQSEKIVFMQNKYYEKYENQLKMMSLQKVNISELIANPEKIYECLTWDLLTIRNSVIINIQLLIENELIGGNYMNMIRLIVSNIYQKQCLQICEQIFAKSEELQSSLMEQIQFSQVLREIQNFGYYPSYQSLKCLKKVIEVHKGTFSLNQIKDLALFTEMCKMLTLMVRQGSLNNNELRQIGSELLHICIPDSVKELQASTILNGYQAISTLLQFDFSSCFFTIFVQLFNMNQQNDFLKAIMLQESRVKQLIEGRNVYSSSYLIDQYNILSFILRRGEFSIDAYNDSWSFVNSQVQVYRSMKGMHLIDLFRYFNEGFNNNQFEYSEANIKDYYTEQLDRILNVLQKLGSLLETSVYLSDIKSLLQLYHMFNIYLFECLTEIEKQNLISSSTITKDIVLYISNQFKILDHRKWRPIFKDKSKLEIKNQWWSSYLALLILVPISSRINRNSPLDNLRGVQMKVKAKFGQIEGVMEPFLEEEEINVIKSDEILTLECSKLVRRRIQSHY